MEDTSDPEDRWYKEDDHDETEKKQFDLSLVISISKEGFEEWCRRWKFALIIKVLGKRFSLVFMEYHLKRYWVRKGKIDVIDMNRDYFLVHFSDKKNYSHVLLEGPWMVVGHYLIIQRWRPFFLSSKNYTIKDSYRELARPSIRC
ncbi:hypothetical protein Ahy_B02g058962 isoform A [Arachis hypogaea]|uniref:DUF4283 domain-containing protein n=1 Tax=Arachis hypogaea TaxID=3818 RepID=A0A445AFU3_ARAHY|nr:hypothetical protein Ahy_B02g058962 isoform A [Arachis hypogaea]